MSISEWTYDEADKVWVLAKQNAYVTIAPRAGHCDRGRWVAVVSGVGNIDQADEFPRYFMDLERAKLEMAEWLSWRLLLGGEPGAYERWNVRALLVDDLKLVILKLQQQRMLSDEDYTTLKRAHAAISQRASMSAAARAAEDQRP